MTKFKKRISAQKYYYIGYHVLQDKITQKIDIQIPDDYSHFIIQNADLSHVFGCNLEQNQTRVIKCGKGPHFPQYSYDIITKNTFSEGI